MDGVSVVIPCYNGEKYLRACIESALQQDYSGPVEILVGDDGSTDGSVRVAASFGSAVKVLQHPGGVNRGLPATRNLCIRAGSHPLVALLDADDLWLPCHLTALAEALAAHPAAGMAYDNGHYMTEEGEPYGDWITFDPPSDPESLFLNCCLVPTGVLIPRVVFEEIGLFDEDLRCCEDYDMWLRVVERFPIAFVPMAGYLYRQHPQQLSKSVENLLSYGWPAVAKARARYPYPRSLVRRRHAVFSYRLSQATFRKRQFLHAAYHLARAALYDPTRAVGELVRRARRQKTA